ncbi:STAS domain-containing protein [Reinekea sp.]|jgi:anti-anti-sigma factor|uniref:STAS domain-containing protein n=1 Tax=Reinekea sp. TaxID=1970455 RepID=UPI002A800114|nr:STAS domain-containing protein [Reinekea sp.]
MSKVSVLRLPNRFDFQHHVAFTADYEKYLADKEVSNLQLDFSRVRYLDSSALGMMVLLAKKARASEASVTLEVIGANGAARDILEMANMAKFYQIK